MMRSRLCPGDRVRVRTTGQIGAVAQWFENGHAFVRFVRRVAHETFEHAGLYHRSELEKVR